MTRKQFQAIADAIKATPLNDPQDRIILACRMADVCAPTNPRFNRALFLRACGVPAACGVPSGRAGARVRSGNPSTYAADVSISAIKQVD